MKAFGALGLIVVYLTLFVGGIYGWILNLLNILHYDHIVLTGKVALQVIGIFIPFIGSIMGFLV
jgi:hypothetical protein